MAMIITNYLFILLHVFKSNMLTVLVTYLECNEKNKEMKIKSKIMSVIPISSL